MPSSKTRFWSLVKVEPEMTDYLMAQRGHEVAGILHGTTGDITPSRMQSGTGSVPAAHVVEPFTSVAVELLHRIA